MHPVHAPLTHSVMFFYRVRVDSQVYVVSPRKGTDITSYQSEGWVDVSSAETRNQVRSGACFILYSDPRSHPKQGLDCIRLHAAHALLGGAGWQSLLLGHDERVCQRALDTEGSFKVSPNVTLATCKLAPRPANPARCRCSPSSASLRRAGACPQARHLYRRSAYSSTPSA